MKAQNLGAKAPVQPVADVAVPQLGAFGEFTCQFRSLSATVKADRTQAVFPSQKGAAQSTPPVDKWSRGCRALKLPFWRCALPLSWLAAQRKPKMSFTLTSLRSPKNRPTPANTSKTIGRVSGLMALPALFLSADQIARNLSARTVLVSRKRFAAVMGLGYAAPIHNAVNWSIPCVPQPSLPSSRFPLSPLAPKKKRPSSLLRWMSPSSRPRPANTSNPAGRGCGPACASAMEVATC